MAYPSREELQPRVCQDVFRELCGIHESEKNELQDGGFCRLIEATQICVHQNLDDEFALPTIQYYLRGCPTPHEWTEQRILEELAGTRADIKARQTRELTNQRIIIVPPECDVVDEASASLAKASNLYQRGNALSRIVESTRPPAGITRPVGTPVIEILSDAALQEQLSRLAGYFRFNAKKELVRTTIPDWVVRLLSSRNHWPVPPLEGVIESAVFRPNGTVLTQKGYDAATGLYLTREWDLPEITLKDAKALLEELVCDFPFKGDAHRSAYFAALITPFARYAFHGNTPMFLFDGNNAGTGKTLLGDTIGMIFGGRPLSRLDMPTSNDEWRKKITTVAMAGDPILFIDNIDDVLESSALDSAITAASWRDRILGKTQQVEVPLNWTLIGNGVNIRPGGTIYRRVVVSRLETNLENPENRTEFTHPDLLGFVSDNRQRIIAAVLKILQHYHDNGRPRQSLPGFGSFNEWSDLVRSAIVYAGWPDPCSTRAEFAQASDPNAELLKSLIAGWREADPDNLGMTVAEAIERRNNSETLSAAISIITTPGNVSMSLGRKIAGFRDTPSGGFCFHDAGNRSGVKLWKVIPVNN
jgi:hypothetical protein